MASPAGGARELPAERRRLSVCLINPRFDPSYWGFEYALPLYPGNKRSTMISGSLPTVAALGGDHDFTLLDENVEDIDWSLVATFDVEEPRNLRRHDEDRGARGEAGQNRLGKHIRDVPESHEPEQQSDGSDHQRE